MMREVKSKDLKVKMKTTVVNLMTMKWMMTKVKKMKTFSHPRKNKERSKVRMKKMLKKK